MIRLMQVFKDSPYIVDICYLITKYSALIFGEYVNPIEVFLEGLMQKKIVVIGAFKRQELIAFLVLYNFQKISHDNFNCYIYGASIRGNAAILDFSMNYIFEDLKLNGCNVIRFETKEYNMPMRKMANRLGFNKISILHNTCSINGKYRNSILYEKIL